MKPVIYFIENEVKRKELFAEFYIEQIKNRNVVATMLIDNETKEIKETHIFEELFIDGEYSNSNTIEMNINFKPLKAILIDKIINSDLTKNFYTHY